MIETMSLDDRWHVRALELAAGELPMLIGGQSTTSTAGRRYDVIDPSNGSVVAAVPDATAGDVESAITAADDALRAWSLRPYDERAAVVRAMADIAERHIDEIAALDSLDTGVPWWMMRRDVATGIQRMRMFADWALRLTGETVPATPTHLTYTERIPWGVVGRIIAYNHPAMFGISKIAAPLIAGNTVVLKPSEQTPLSMLWLGVQWAEIIPAGVLSVISGGTPETGIGLVADPRVRRIAFTGSPQTGRSIQRTAADVAVKHVSLELGGKNALLVLDDADLDDVVDGAVKGMNLAFAGQSCGSTSRLLVPTRLLDQLVDQLAARFDQLRIGRAFDRDSQVSPLISSAHLDRVRRWVANAVAGTAQRAGSGSVPDRLSGGFFHPPTLLVESNAASPLATEEVFGPVLTIIPTEDTDQAVSVANAVRYGLTASVYGRDIERTLAVARRLDAGYVWVNDTSTHFAGLPFGGVKESGVGREESFDELLDYTQLRTTSVRLG